MKKIFVLTGEPSGDKLASKVIARLQSTKPDIEYLSVGGEHLKTLGIKSLYDLKEVTYLGFTSVLLNVFKIKKKINETVKEIVKFKPDILFHFAGQSLVSVGYSNPLDTLNTNIIGTYNVLNYFDKIDSVKSIVVSTTDKVYLKPSEENIETSALGGSDFYSASKASAEFVISSFLNNGSSANVSVVRSGNVLGGGDRANNRLIPDLIKSIIDNQSFTIRQPNSTRPWCSVAPCSWRDARPPSPLSLSRPSRPSRSRPR